MNAFLVAAKSELSQYSPDLLRGGGQTGVNTLYFGGGTPSVLDICQLASLVPAGVFEEFTVEVNPDDIVEKGPDYARGLLDMGVNRISMGVQSFDDAVLHTMGRRHDSAGAFRAYRLLRQAGFSNIGIDLIFGFSSAFSIDAVRSALESLPDLPQHISCYQLSIEEGCGLDRMIRKNLYAMPSDEECASQYNALGRLLESLGYEHYEISNWAVPGFRSRHNSACWDYEPYIGIGPGAHSMFVDDAGTVVRRWNIPDVAGYVEAARKGDFSAVREGETLTLDQMWEERVLLGLRTAEGVDAGLFAGRVPDRRLRPVAARSGRLRIPEEQWFVSDSIITDIFSYNL